jgi:hypothetical protein
MASSRIAGITSATVDGSAFDLTGEVIVTTNKTTKEPQIPLNGWSGQYKETVSPGKMVMTILGNQGVDPSIFQNLTNSTVQFVAPDGKTYIGTGMIAMDVQEVNVIENSFQVTWMGPDVYVQGVAN